jgi:hypothetical protein
MQSKRDGEFGFTRSRRSGDGEDRIFRFFSHSNRQNAIER